MAAAPEARRPLPTGTVTFLRTDVEGSMRLAHALGAATWDELNELHLGILRGAIDRHGGVCVRTEGDALFAAFPEAGAAVLAAIDGQRALITQRWPEEAAVRVRMGVHTGEAHLSGDDYGGFDVSRAARIAAVGHGGQIIVSGTTYGLVESNLPSDVAFRELGRHALPDLPVPEQLFQVDVPGMRTDFPPLRVAAAVVGNLPERLTSFVGRANDLDELRRLLASNRLVTLTGPGGIGKTSLAVELARGEAGSFTDGAWYVALDAVTEPGMVTSVAARTLGLFDGVERPAADALAPFLAPRSILMVLDNFEHLLEAAGDVASLVRASPRSRFIVTSRAPLHVAGEQEYPVRPLAIAGPTPAVGATPEASIQLFIDRARAVRPDWEPGPDAPLVQEICERLDGLPLGIELAAARLSLMPVRAIRDRLASNLPLPGSGPRDAPARQRTLEGAIQWSHDLLAPEDQRTLHQLAVFDGTFDAEQVARVVLPTVDDGTTPDVLDRLFSLAERSLISRDLTPLGEDARLVASGIRFGLLRTVGAFAATRLVADGGEADVRERHAQAFVELAEAAARHLNTGRQPPWLDRLARDDANLRAALRWSIATGDVERAQRLIAALWRYWLIDGRLAEGAEWVDAVFALPGSERPTPALVGALAAAGGVAYWRAEREASLHLYEQQLAVAQIVDDAAGIADAYFNLSAVTYLVRDITRAQECAREAHRRLVDIGDEIGVNRMEWAMTNLTMFIHGPQAAASELEPILDRAEELDDAPYVALASSSLAWTAYMLGDVASAVRWTIKAMLGTYGIRDLASSTIGLPIGAVIALEAGRPYEAAMIMGAFEALSERYGVRPPLGVEELIRSAEPLESARSALEPEAFAEALESGRRMTLGEAIDLITHTGEAAPAP